MAVMTCLLCGERGEGKKFSFHVNSHSLSTEEYTRRHILGLDARPACAAGGCTEEVRYVAFTFRRYCRSHSRLAEAEGGKVGGRAKETWNKGKTAADDPRIVSFSGSSNPFFGKRHDPETMEAIRAKNRLSFAEVRARVEERRGGLSLLTGEDEYKSRQHQYLRVVCLLCEREQEKTLQAIERGSRCPFCFPTGSIPEDEIAAHVMSLGLEVIRNTRRIIPPKELDIWVPERNIAIEHHGLYWHSGGRDRDPGYTRKLHREKFVAARERGIRLIQFFSDEWRDRGIICRSMIDQRLGMSRTRLGARECTLERIDPTEGRAFFEASHIDGAASSSVYFGLRRGESIVCAVSLRRPIQGKHGRLCEVARLATSVNTVVAGGASRLIREASEWARERGFEGLLSYSNNRFGLGDVYTRLGFKRLGETGIDYWYTDGKARFDRFRFRASDGMSERQVAENAGVRQVHGACHGIHVLRF